MARTPAIHRKPYWASVSPSIKYRFLTTLKAFTSPTARRMAGIIFTPINTRIIFTRAHDFTPECPENIWRPAGGGESGPRSEVGGNLRAARAQRRREKHGDR